MSFSDTDMVRVLREVARRLKRTPSTKELADAQAAGAWNPFLPLWDQRDVDQVVRYLRAHPPRTETGVEPDAWLEHSILTMERFKEEQADALALFALDKPLELAEVADFLLKRAEREPWEGDPLYMTLPSARGYPETAIRFFRGYFEDEAARKLREARQATSVDEYLRHINDVKTWATARANPLYRFSQIVESVVDIAQISELAAIAFLLADVPVRLPRLSYHTRLRWGGKNPGLTITVSVHDPSVEPREVARAYRRVRSEMLRDGAVFSYRDRGPRQRIRTMDARTRQMLAFCRARRGTQKFPRIAREWNEAHPEWKYKTPKSLYNAYRAAEARWGAAAKTR